jgi:DNA recombination protein RmuC
MDAALYLLLGLAIGAGLGGAIGWLAGWRRAATRPPDTRIESELRQQLAQRDSALSQAREQLARVSAANATAEAGRGAAETLLAEQRQLQDKAIAELREAFKALSADALRQTAPEFLRLAEQTLGKFQEAAKGDLVQRQEAIKGLVEPLRQKLDDYQKRLQQSENAQSGALGEVKQQLETLAQQSQSLAAETAQFRSVLRSNQARGRWGEETLRRVVEAAGMSAHCDFAEQAMGDEGKPDLIVKLPENRLVIVDSKVPDLDVVSATEAAEPARRAEMLATHAAKLRQTIKSLSDRDYPKQFPNALDHVVLFLPAESLFSTALEGDPELIVWAESRRVYLATPASFIAVLRTIEFIWRQHRQTENARDIAVAAQEFYLRVTKFTEHFDKIRSGLGKANEAFNEAVGSYERMVRPGGEKLLKLGGGATGKELADLQPLETTLRLPPTE